jgi:hypothetical protein
MGKMKIEIKKPQHLEIKEKEKQVKQAVARDSGGLPGVFSFLLLTSYVFCGAVGWFVLLVYLNN